jgi:DNA polymerase-3 subunit alpha
MSDFVHVHVHTEYSPLDAPVALGKLTKQAKELGYDALACTDHGTVSGWVKFAEACEKVGIKPIFGVEAYFTPDRHVRASRSDNSHLLLLAKDDVGIKNIYRLTEAAWKDGFYYDPRLDWDLLQQFHEGVICTSACVGGVVPRAAGRGDMKGAAELAGRFREIFGEDYYLEVQHHNLEIERASYEGIARIAAQQGIPIVGTNDVHHVTSADADIQETMMAVSMHKCMKDPARLSHGTNQFYLKSPEEMTGLFGGSGARAVVSTMEIAEKCTAKLNLGAMPTLPTVDMPAEFDDEMDYLEHLARLGMKRLGISGKPEYEERFREETTVIRDLKAKGYGFDRYFLIVAEYVDWAWKNGIRVGAGRGSGAGSLLLYCLSITGVDPLPLNLLFERFLHGDRNEMPDIDIDFDSERGAEVFDHVRELYGDDRCARIGTISTYHAASAIKAAYRAFDPGNDWDREQEAKKKAQLERERQKNSHSRKPAGKKEKQRSETAAMADMVTKLIPRGPGGNPDPHCTFDREKVAAKDDYKYLYDEVPQFNDFRGQWPEIFAFAEAIEGLVERRGVHAAGVLITECPTVELIPQQVIKERAGGQRAATIATAFDMKDVEKLGGIKFDMLQTKVLTVISKGVRTIEERGEWKFDFDIDRVPTDDEAVFALFARGDTLGIFQFESEGMQNLLKKMVPDSFEDVIAANALYRPGPMEHIDSYCDRKHGRERVSYVSPLMEEVLGPTYGIMVYQEQVMTATRLLAGFSASVADKVRKAMGKKKKDLLASLKDQFLEGCEKTGSLSREQALALWGEMEKFGSYAFNKSHSAGYGFTAYQCAWLKAHFPVEFMAGQLSVEGGDSKYDTIIKYEEGLADMKIRLRPLDINFSKGDYVVEDHRGEKVIRRGFKGIKGVGSAACVDIVSGQPYRDVMDFCSRAGAGTQTNVVKVLIEEGAFEPFRATLSKALGREATDADMEAEYADKYKRAQNEKREKGARKEEKEGIGVAFGFDDDDEGDLADDFSL